ncbi:MULTISPECIES: GNAT family N-acetyltransferase [Bacillus]|uniref:GNAT family N-acetyltransferase n=1 Tax=Bacillus TaxID=1386 RepID=UPI002DBB413B|nr:GNAT family N-acetyltransferase [Bacillus sonorensis]
MKDMLTTAVDNVQILFIIKEKTTGEVIGTTSIGGIDVQNRNVEIGWTWLSPAYWRTGVNTESEFLLLQYCVKIDPCPIFCAVPKSSRANRGSKRRTRFVYIE